MASISRRNLLSSGLALSTSALVPRSAWEQATPGLGEAHSGVPAVTDAAVSPRERLLFDFDWKFRFGHATDPSRDLDFGFGQSDFSKTGEFKVSKAGFDDSTWRKLNLPHDWAVELPFLDDNAGTGDSQLRSHGYKPLGRRFPETSVGWYRRVFDIPVSDQGRRISVEFDGAMRDVFVFVNGCFLGRSNNGYVPFRFDLSDFLNYGGTNHIVLRVDASFGDGWFYEGAGLYRHAWLTKTDAVHLGYCESTVRTELRGSSAEVELSTVVQNEGVHPANVTVTWDLLDSNGRSVATARSSPQTIPADGSSNVQVTAGMAQPMLWSVEQPCLYKAVITVQKSGETCDAEHVSFGVRSAVFDPDRGFFLNGKPIKLQGTCNHQDHAGVGAALPDQLQTFRISVLQQMGCNAVRTAHNMPTPEWVEACDRMGMLVACETRQASSNNEGMQQLAALVKRFRNSPSVIVWLIGNEENQLQGPMAQQGKRIATSMVRLCHQLDPTRVVSAAVNGNNEQGISDPVDVVGFNYNTLKFPALFHREHPRRPIFGSEVSSAIATRGEYANDPLRNTISSYAGIAGYETPEEWWSFYGSEEWEAGGFAWTGFDYRGEPTPYAWPSISSQFGIVDTCGFPKDYFFYYRAWWRHEPSLHLFPHWNWHGREGDEIPVWVHSNLDEVELLVNGKSVGTQKVPRLGHVEWKVRYEPGFIEVRGRKGGKVVLTEKRETTGKPDTIRLTAGRPAIDADGEDVAIIKVEVLDAEGRFVPTAKEKVAFKISGPGTLIGVGNGDPNCQESDKEPRRSVFNGLAQVIVQSAKVPGEIRVEAIRLGWGAATRVPAVLVIPANKAKLRPAVL